MRGTNVQNASYQRCPGFPGARSVCNVLVPWTARRFLGHPSPARGTGVHCGTAKGPLGFHSSGPMTVRRGVRRGVVRSGEEQPVRNAMF
eukprot:1195855-Prorocentrum_minimum.AAC.3